MLRKYFFSVFLIMFSSLLTAQQSVMLRYKYRPGDNYRVLSTVNESILENGISVNNSVLVNRITTSIESVDDKGRGLHHSSYMTSVSDYMTGSGEKFTWGEELTSTYYKDVNGRYEIDFSYFVPVIRNVPVFPDYPVKPGDVWTGSGSEVQDLRRMFNLNDPFHIQFTASYKYERDEKGVSSDSSRTPKIFQVISVRYSYNHAYPRIDSNEDLPSTTMGYCNQTIWWDNEKGQIDHYKEDFRIMIETKLGSTLDFKGRSHVEVTDFKKIATDDKVYETLTQIEDMGLKDVSVKKSDNGLTISIENIQFKPDSAFLEDSELLKLEKIAGILRDYPDNDLLVGGHTTNGGSEQGRQLLSEQRAQAVADFLVKAGVKDPYHIFSKGFAGHQPVAPNNTEANKARNRRVEITILDK